MVWSCSEVERKVVMKGAAGATGVGRRRRGYTVEGAEDASV